MLKYAPINIDILSVISWPISECSYILIIFMTCEIIIVFMAYYWRVNPVSTRKVLRTRLRLSWKSSRDGRWIS